MASEIYSTPAIDKWLKTPKPKEAEVNYEHIMRRQKETGILVSDALRVEVRQGETPPREKVVYSHFNTIRWLFGKDIPKPFYMARQQMALDRAYKIKDKLNTK